MLTNRGCCFLALAAAFLLAGALPAESPQQMEDSPDHQYIQQMRSMYNAFKDNSGSFGTRYVGILETKVQIDDRSKYRAWKRNADLINSLLALPKGLNEAGR